MSEITRPPCWTKECEAFTGKQILDCYTSGGCGENGVRKDPGVCYEYFYDRLDESGGDLRSDKYKEGKGKTGRQARQIFGR